MPVTFMHHRMFDRQPLLTIEEAFRYYGAWSGIHDFDFDDAFSDTSIAVTGTGSSVWHTALEGVTLPISYTVSYHKTVATQGVAIGGKGLVHYLVATDASNVYIYYGSSGAYTALLSLPKTTPTEADVTVSFRQIRFSDKEDDLWRVITLYMNDELITTYSEPATLLLEDTKIGFSAYNSDSVTYTDVRIPELTEFAEWGTLDPGETAIGGLQRILDGRYLKFFVRFDGSLRAWRPKSIASSLTFSANDAFEGEVGVDVSQLATHIRMVGAYTWAEAVDEDLISNYGHRFFEDNNPMLMTEKECYQEAERSLIRAQESAFTEDVRTPFTMFLEPEDRVLTPNGDWLVGEIGWEFLSGGINQSLRVRKYGWG